MVSIIVPVYNSEKYIMNCADALINQTIDDIEIIFIDDGSSDNTSDLLKEVKEKDSRIKVFTKENGGASSARNAGFACASGKYIMFCDIDDLLEKNWCEELLKCIENFPGRLPMCAAVKKRFTKLLPRLFVHSSRGKTFRRIHGIFQERPWL